MGLKGMLSSGFSVDLFLIRFRDQRYQRRHDIARIEHDIARIERYLQRGGLGAGHRSYLTRELREREATMASSSGEYLQILVKENHFTRRAVKASAPKENPFLKALRAKGVKSLKEMAEKTGKLEKKSG
jgi:hypothetical protein